MITSYEKIKRVPKFKSRVIKVWHVPKNWKSFQKIIRVPKIQGRATNFGTCRKIKVVPKQNQTRTIKVCVMPRKYDEEA